MTTNTVAPMIAQTMGKVVRPICKVKSSCNRNCPTPQVPNFPLFRTDDRPVRDILLSSIGQLRKERLKGCVCSFCGPHRIIATESPACEAFQRMLRQGCFVSMWLAGACANNAANILRAFGCRDARWLSTQFLTVSTLTSVTEDSRAWRWATCSRSNNSLRLISLAILILASSATLGLPNLPVRRPQRAVFRHKAL
jgi:hypothetical protein